jgi:hypothetical protein
MNVKNLASKVLGVTYDYPVNEISYEGVYVKYDGASATVGANTTPALARAYMLLAKGVSEGKNDFVIEETAHFDMCGVMLDMSFGSVTKPAGVKKYLDYMALFGMNMLMLYTEDTYEVEEYPLFGYQRGRYTLEELKDIDDYAFNLGIEVIPCIQTFGHLRQFLRYRVHADIAENDSVLLPGEEKTYQFIEACIATCKKAFRSSRIHIGCDETRGLGFGKSFARDGYRDRFEIYNEHLGRVVDICKKYEYRPMMWSDMYSTLASNKGAVYSVDTEIPQYVIDAMPDADMVFWNYYKKDNEFYGGNLDKHLKFGRNVIFAGGIWTWNGAAPNFTHTYDTVRPAMEECLKRNIRSVFAAAWAYGDINHIQALPCCAIYSEYCWRGLDCTKEDVDSIAEFITGTPAELCDAISDYYCGEGGDRNGGKVMMWSDPLINLICYGYDLPKYEACFENSLRVFEKYPNAPYVDFYKVLFRCALAKTRLHMTFRDHYKAGDKAWLKEFADVTLPEMLKDFELLYQLHDKYWHEESKTHGFEKLGNAYAAAIERIRFTIRELNRYLDGTITEIEALEPEVLKGSLQKHIMAYRVMQTY